ncbi:MAG: M28 family peptidase [Methylocystaceae bacterium]
MSDLTDTRYIKDCLQRLAIEIGPRPAGSSASHQAAEFVAGELQQAGYKVTWQKYPCPDWQLQSGELIIAGEKVEITVNRFCPSCEVTAPLALVSSLEELRDCELTNKIVILNEALTQGGFFPKNFDFIRDETQDEIIRILEEERPSAIIAINQYSGPHPGVIEDSEFYIPSVTVSQPEGQRILAYMGSGASLKVISQTLESSGANLVGLKSAAANKKILICAHYDTYHGSPGALDNGAGIAAMLYLARLLKTVPLKLTVEMVAFGGEDSWYPGDASYMKGFKAEDIVAAINIDGCGYPGSNTNLAFFNWPEEQEKQIFDRAGSGYVKEPFYESDHGFFWTLGIPTLAITTSDYMRNLLGTIVHTKDDTPAVVDTLLVEQVSKLVFDVILMLDELTVA